MHSPWDICVSICMITRRATRLSARVHARKYIAGTTPSRCIINGMTCTHLQR